MNIVKEILSLKKQVKQLYCYLTGNGAGGAFTESDPTVPQYVKDITTNEIAYWNERREDANLYITEKTDYANVGDVQLTFNRNIAYALENLDVDTSDKADLNAGNVDVANAILWRNALDVYNKSEVDNKFYQGGEEALTELTDVSLTANVLYISYIGENGNTQTKSVDLSGLATIDIHIEDASYNAATNIISLNDNDGNEYNIDLSEFSIITETGIDGVTTLTQEAVTKLTVSKVGQTGQYADLLGKPVIPAPVDISGKLDKPTTDGSWVVTKSGSTITYTNASALGQNIANSNLTSVAGAGITLGAPYVWNTANQPFSITGLPDKSADASFDRIKVQNSLGQEAIASNMYNVLFKGLTGLTAQQATNVSYLLNGGIGSDGPMSVNNISPPIIQNRFDSVEYVLLRGVNLNLSAIGRGVEILAADKITVVLTIPDNQIQTSLDGQELVFYYNFYNFPIGTYYIRITSGVKQYTTELNFKIVQEIQDINTNGITWDFVYDNAYAPHSTSDTAAGSSFYILPKRTDTITPVVCLKSSEIFAEGDDFYLEYRVLLTGQDEYNAKSYIGLGYSNAINNLQNNSLIYSNFSGDFIYPSFLYRIGNNSTPSANIAVGADYTVIIVKTGNLFRTIISGVNKSTVLSNNSGYSIFAALIGRGKNQTSVTCQIIKAFKFN